MALAREHRAPPERFAATLEANDDRLGGHEVDVAVDAALGGWPTPRFDPASEAKVARRHRALFETEMIRRGLGANGPFRVRRDLWARTEAAVRSGAGRLVEPTAQRARSEAGGMVSMTDWWIASQVGRGLGGHVGIYDDVLIAAIIEGEQRTGRLPRPGR